MQPIAALFAFLGVLTAGVWLCTIDYPTLGGALLILSLLGSWGFEKRAED